MNVKIARTQSDKDTVMELHRQERIARVNNIVDILDGVPFYKGLKTVSDIMYIGNLLTEYSVLTGSDYIIKERKII